MSGNASSSPQVTMINVTLSGNTANDEGGAVFNRSSNLDNVLNNVTMTANKVVGGAGGEIRNETDAVLKIKNSIVADNTRQGSAGDWNCSGSPTSLDFNLENPPGATSCGLNEANDVDAADPKLGPLQNNGGQTETHALLPGSPAIDKGDPDAPDGGGTNCDLRDQRGVDRPKDGDGTGGPRCDMGAFELAPGSHSDGATLTVRARGKGKGRVTSAPVGIKCRPVDAGDCTEAYAVNTPVKLTAQPKPDSIFVGWGGACKHRNARKGCVLTMDADKLAVARFKPAPSSLPPATAPQE